MEKSKSSLLSSSIFCVRQMVLRVGFKFKLTMARVRTPAPSRLLLALLAGAGVQTAMALPQGGQVTSGTVTIGTPTGGSLNITQASNKGVIDWQSFNVASGEKVNFLQPSATSSTLNRVIGSDPTSIFGQINANGQVFLVNNSGVYFAPGAQVNAAGLVASTLALSDADYLAGNYVFSGTGGTVDNRGVLKAGFVALAGAQVSNTGTIVADGGTAALAAGGRVTMNLTGSELVSVSVDAPLATALVHSGGIVQADGGQVLISAKAADALLGTVVNVDGIVQAHSIGSRNGVITLDGGSSGAVNVSGTLDASGKAAGETGGTVKVTGANVGVFGGTIDASGDAGGGVVRVGGDWHGAGADGDANASQTIVDGESVINANALTSGNGGNVVLWSDGRTQFTGAISAKSGSAGGNGGDVETSAKDVLQVTGSVDLGATAGKGGTWLLDPNNITVSSGSSTHVNGNFTSTDDNAVVSNTALAAALTSGAIVNVTTASGGGNTQGGDITIAADIAASSLTGSQTATLNFNAQRNITMTGANISAGTSNTSLSVNFNAGTNGGGTGTPGANPGTFSMDSTSSVNTGAGGNLHVTTQGTAVLGTLTVGGDLQIASNGGAVSQLTAASNPIAVTGNTTVNAGAASINLGNASNTFGGTVGLTNSGANDVTVYSANGIEFATTTLGSGAFSVQTSGGDITQSGAITQEANAGLAGFGAGNHGINLSNAGNDFTGAVALTNAGSHNVSLTDANSLTLSGMAIGTGTNTISAGSAAGDTLSRTGSISGTNVTLSVGGNSPDTTVRNFFMSGTATTVSIAETSTTALNVTATGVGALPSLVVSGNLDLTATSSVTQNTSTSLQVTGTTTVNAGTNSISLTKSGNSFGQSVSLNNTGAHNVAITAGGALQLGTSSVGTGSLNVIAGGAITQSGALTQAAGAGTASFTISGGGAHSISLSNTGNDFTGAVSLTNSGAHDVTLTDENDLTLGTISIGSGTNAITAGTTAGTTLQRTGTITAGTAPTLSIGGATPDASLASYLLTGAATTIAIKENATTEDLTATGVGALPDLHVSGDLSLTASSNVSQNTGTSITVGGATSVTGGAHKIDLSHATNDFTGAVTLTNSGANDVTLATDANLVLGGLTLGTGVNTLSAGTATGSQLSRSSGTLTAGTLPTFNVGGNAVDTTVASLVMAGTSVASTVSVTAAASGQDVAATNVGALPSLTVSGDLSLTAASDISQNASTVLNVTGATTVLANAHAVDLSHTGNTFGGDVSISNTGAHDVSLAAGGALSLGNLAVGSGALTVTSGGDLTQSGTIVQETGAGATSFNAGAHAISLNDANDFTGAVSLTNSGSHAVALSDINDLVLGGLSLGSGSNTISVGTVVGIGSTLSRTSGTFTAGAAPTFHVGPITADSSVVSFFMGGTSVASSVSMVAASPTELFVAAAGVSALPSLTVSGDLDLTASGNISQNASTTLNVGGATTIHGGAHAVDLSHAGNVFGGDVSITNTGANNVTLGATGALSLGTTSVGSGTLGVTSTAGISEGSNTITQAAGAGAASFTAGAGVIALGNAGNDFTGPVSLSNSGTNSVALATSGDLTLGTVGIGGGTNTLSAGSAAGTTLSRTGTFSAGGTTTLSVGGSAPDSTVAGFFVSGPATTVTITENATTEDLTATGVSALPSLNVSGNLDLTASGNVSQNAATTIAVGGTTHVTGGAHAIDLSHTGNTFGSTVTVSNTGNHDVALGATGALALGATSVGSGALTVTATAGISEGSNTITQQSGAGVASFSAGAGAIALGSAGNSFTGAVSLANTGANDVTLANTGNLTLSGLNIGSGTNAITTSGTTLTRIAGSFSAGSAPTVHIDGLTVDPTLAGFLASGTATGMTLAADGSAIDLTATGVGALPSLTVSGNLDLTAGTDITQNTGSALDVTGTTNVHGGAHAIVLDHTGNSFTGAVSLSNTGVNDVTLATAGNLALGGLNIGSGTNVITVGTGAGVTLSRSNQVLTAGAPIALTVGGSPLDSTVSSLFFGGTSVASNVSITSTATGADVTAAGVGALPGLTVDGNLDLTASSNVSQNASTTLDVTGTTTVHGGAHAIDLSHSGNVFGGDVSITNSGANAVSVGATGALSLGASTLGSGALTVATTAGISETGAITQSGGTSGASFDGGTGSISLGLDNDIKGSVSLAKTGNGSVAFHDVGAIDLGASSSGTGGFTISTTGGDITQSGDLTLGGTSSFSAGTHDVTLDRTGNSFALLALASGHSVDVAATGNLVLHPTIANTGDLTVRSTTGSIDLGATPISTSGDITLNSATFYATTVSLTGEHVSITGSGIELDNDVTAGHTGSTDTTLTLDATNGAISQVSGAVVSHGASSVTAAGASKAVSLVGPGNDFTGLVTVDGGATQLTGANALSVHLGASTTTADLHASGGALTVDGTTSSDLTAHGVGIVFGSGTTTVGGVLDAESTGNISQTGALSLLGAGTNTVNATLAHTVTLDNTSNSFVTTQPLSVTGSSVVVYAAGDLDISPNIASTGDLTLHALGTGTLTLPPGTALTTSGNVDLLAGAGLSTASDITATSITLGGGSVTIASAIHGTTLTVASDSTISESAPGAITVDGATTLTAGAATPNAISLDEHTNSFGGLVTVARAGDVTLRSEGALSASLDPVNGVASATLTSDHAGVTVSGRTVGDLNVDAVGAGSGTGTVSFGATHVGGNLMVNGAGLVSQTGDLGVTGTTGLNAAPYDITLDRVGNSFGDTVSVNAGNVVLNGGTSPLKVALGAATTADLTTTGLLTFSSGSVGDVTLHGNGIVLAGSTQLASLDAHAGSGDITEPAAIAVTGTTALTTTGNITLAQSGNSFGGIVTVDGGNVALATNGALSIDGATTGSLTLTAAGVNFASSAGALSPDTSVGTNLSVISTAGISESGSLAVAGSSTLSATGGNIALGGTNDFTGSVSASANSVQLSDVNLLSVILNNVASATLSGGTGIDFSQGDSAVTGNLSANSGTGGIGQSSLGTLTVGGTATLTAGSGIALTSAQNDFNVVNVTAAQATTIVDQNAMTVHLGTAGTVTSAALTATAGKLTVDGTVGASTPSPVALAATGAGVEFGTTVVHGKLTAGGTGAITQTGTLTVDDTSALNVGTNAITLGLANTLTGDVTVTSTGAGNTVVVNDSSALNAHLAGTGTTTLTSAGLLSIDGTTTTGSLLKATGNGVRFTSAGTTLGGALEAHAGSLGGGIVGNGALTVAGASTLDGGNASIFFTTGPTHFGGDVTVQAAQAVQISDTGALTVHLGSTGTVDNASLAAVGALSVDGGTTTSLGLAGDSITFGNTHVGTTLTAYTASGAGDITQTGSTALTVGGATTLTAGANDIALANTASGGAPLNQFGGAVGIVSAHDVAISGLGALTAHVAATNDATLTAAGALAIDGTVGGALTVQGSAIDFGAGTTQAGSLAATATSGGLIKASQAIVVTGASAFDTTGIIDLSNTGNHFTGGVTLAEGNATLVNTGDLSATLSNVASANLTATGALTVQGTTSSTAPATGNVSLSGTSVTIGNAGLSAAGALVATATAGDVQGNGATNVGGTSHLTATGNISLNTPADTFGGAVTASAGGNLTLSATGPLGVHVTQATNATLVATDLLTVDAGNVTGNLQVTGNGVAFGPGTTTVGGGLQASSGSGDITQAGALSVAGATMLNAGAATDNVTLGLANQLAGDVTLNGGNVTLANSAPLTAHLNNTVAATLTSTGQVTVDGSTTATGGTGNLSVTGTSVRFGLAGTSVAGDLTAAGGPIGQNGGLVVNGNATLDAGATGAITLNGNGNDFKGTVSTTGGTVALTDGNDLVVHLGNTAGETLVANGLLTIDGTSLGDVSATGVGVVFGATTIGTSGAPRNLVVASGAGSITQTGAITVTGTTSLDPLATIKLDNTANDFVGAVTATGGDVTLADANDLLVHLSATNGTLTAGGKLTVDGAATGNLTTTSAGAVFGATTVGGTLSATSTGDVAQTGDLNVTGMATIAAAGHDVTLARQTNQLAGGVTLTAATADIEQAGTLAVHLASVGGATLKSGAALSIDGSSTGDVNGTGTSVAIGSAGAAIGGNLSATATTGGITESGSLAVTGTSALQASNGDINLAAAGNGLTGAVTATAKNVTLTNGKALTAHVAANGAAALTATGFALTVDGSSNAMTLNGGAVEFGAAGTTVNGALSATGTSIGQQGALAVTGLSTFSAGSGDILLDSPGTNLQSAITATGGKIHLTDAHAIDADITASGEVVLSSTADVKVKGAFNGSLKVTGAHVSLDQGSISSPLTVGGPLDVTSSGDTSLGYVNAGGATVNATGALQLEGTLKSSGTVTLNAQQIQGVNKLGALDVAGGAAVYLSTLSAGGGNIGKNPTTAAGQVDDQSIISLLGATGQSSMHIAFNPGQSAWFRVTSQGQTSSIITSQDSSLRGQTFFCDTTTCVNKLGQTTVIADTVVSNILSAAAQDAADAAFGTENLDFAIRKGYVTTIGRVPPGIDEIAGDLGATQCDSRVTSATSISANGGCGLADPKGGPKRNPLDKVELPKN